MSYHSLSLVHKVRCCGEPEVLAAELTTVADARGRDLAAVTRQDQGWNSQFCFWSRRIYNGGRIGYIKNHGLIVFILSYTSWLLCHGFADE